MKKLFEKNKNLFALVLIFLILLLDWTALDDITTGNEPNYYSEWIFLFTSIPILIFIFFKWKKITKKSSKN